MDIIKKIRKNININYNDYFSYRFTIDDVLPKTPREKFTLHIINSLQELEELINENYDFCESPLFEIAKKNIAGNQTFFLYFVEKKLAHANCIVKDEPIHDPQLKAFKANNALFVGPSFTTEEHRRKGFNVFDLVEACKYFQKNGYKYAYASAKTTNKAAIFDVMAAGYEMIDKVRVYRFMKFVICRSIQINTG